MADEFSDEKKSDLLKSFTEDVLTGVRAPKKVRGQDGPPLPAGPAVSFDVAEREVKVDKAEETRLNGGKRFGSPVIRVVAKNPSEDLAH